MEKKRCVSCFREYEGELCPHCGGARNEEHQLPVGTVIRDRYQIGRVLGQGGFGITYVAWDTLMQKSVAVKEFYPSGTVFRKSEHSTAVECGTKAMIPHYEYSRERFLREASALVQFQDIPEVVGIQDFVKENNTAYIVMEYVRGVDLAKYIQRKGGRLSVEETFRILRPVMEALAKVHKGGIVHRDISPDNIILDPMGGAKLLDFGAVRAVEDPDVDKGLSKSTEAILKQGFAPIEQYNSRGSLGPWTDEYAMCATVFYCLTGKIPEEASIRMSEGIDPDWSSIPGLPEHQQKALEKGISCRAKDRYKNMDELLAALFPTAERAVPAEVPTPPPAPRKEEKPKKQPKEQKPKGKKKALIFAAVAAFALILLAAVVLLPGKQEGASPAQLQDAPGTLPSEAPGETQPNIPETAPTTEPPAVPLSPEEQSYLLAEQLLAEGKLGEAAIAFGKLAGYSDARERSFEIWDKIAVRETLVGGSYYTVGLKNDRTLVTTGLSDALMIQHDGEQQSITDYANIVAISAGHGHFVALRADGTVIASGDTENGKCDVGEWTDIVAICAGREHTVGLKADGTVVAVGSNDDGKCNVEDWTDIVAICTGNSHTVGLKVDGTVVAIGNNGYAWSDAEIWSGVETWTDIVAIASGSSHTVGLKADGTVVAVGWDMYKQCDVTAWSDIVAITAYGSYTLALRSDGTALATGFGNQGECEVTKWTNIVAISSGGGHTLGLKADGTAVAVGHGRYGECFVGGWTDLMVPRERVSFR